MKRNIIIIGSKFGRLTIINEVNSVDKYKRRRVLCQCDCGKFINVNYNSIKFEHTKSCGCLHDESCSKNGSNSGYKNLPSNLKHYDSITKHYLYTRWKSIKQRCYNKNHKRYNDYGGRGITMYEPWINNYSLFKKWILDNLGECPKGYSTDRIDNDKGYEPGNLRWATDKEQANNKKRGT